MLKNFLTIAIRNLRKHRLYSVVNIGGLAIGMAVAMLIGLWIWDELSFNTYHQHYDRIARVMKRSDNKGMGWVGRMVPYPMIEELEKSYGRDFKYVVPATPEQKYILMAGDKALSETGQFIGEDAPDMLTLKMLSGTRSALKDPYSIMLSASAAKALFGNADPLEKLVKLGDSTIVKVTGVYADLPQNTQFHSIQFFSPWKLFLAMNPSVARQGWDNNFLILYAELPPNTDFTHVSADIKDVELDHARKNPDMQMEVHDHLQLWLSPMSQWHLYSSFKNGVADRGPIRFVWLVGIIGAFVLILACINFMNLSTARSEKRAREVGIRKVAGSGRGQIIIQFFGESFVVVIFAFAVSLLLVAMALPYFNELASKQITMPWREPWLWACSIGFIAITGLLAGVYPALYLSSFQPVKVLKGSFRLGHVASVPRKLLVGVQFTISICLIICTIVVYDQILFAKNRPVGYSRDGLVMIRQKMGANVDYHVLRAELINSGAVTDMAESGGPVTAVWSGNSNFDWKGKNPNLNAVFATLGVTPEYGHTLGWQFLAGRDFSPLLATDSAGFIINEAAAKLMGFTDPVGKLIQWNTKDYRPGAYKILGVIHNMVMSSPFDPVEPAIFFLSNSNQLSWINIRINPALSAGQALSRMETVFKKLIPSAPFEYTFADEEYAKKFATEERIGRLAGLFAVLAIFISCLGLFGMASFVAGQRVKEIGIRKVLGASVFGIWRLLSKEFIVLVLVSLVIATPIAWVFMHHWLQNYQYHSDLSWWMFAATGAGTILLTLFTVSYQSLKAALMNPTDSLHNE